MNADETAQKAYEHFSAQTMPEHVAVKWHDLPPMYRDAWKSVVDLVSAPVPPAPSEIPDDVWSALHHVWSWCVGKPGYDKQYFVALERRVLEAGRTDPALIPPVPEAS